MKSGAVITTLLDFRAHLGIVACAREHYNNGPKSDYALTFNMEHSIGALHPYPELKRHLQ
jgi:hypothetical protein